MTYLYSTKRLYDIYDRLTGRQVWRAEECAAYCHVGVATWIKYSHDKRTPPPVGKIGRSPLWDAEEVKDWENKRRAKRPKKHV